MPGFGIIDLWRLQKEYGPVIALGQKFLAAEDAPARAQAIADIVEWFASKSENKLDDKYARHLSVYLHSPMGAEFVSDLVADAMDARCCGNDERAFGGHWLRCSPGRHRVGRLEEDASDRVPVVRPRSVARKAVPL